MARILEEMEMILDDDRFEVYAAEVERTIGHIDVAWPIKWETRLKILRQMAAAVNKRFNVSDLRLATYLGSHGRKIRSIVGFCPDINAIVSNWRNNDAFRAFGFACLFMLDPGDRTFFFTGDMPTMKQRLEDASEIVTLFEEKRYHSSPLPYEEG